MEEGNIRQYIDKKFKNSDQVRQQWEACEAKEKQRQGMGKASY